MGIDPLSSATRNAKRNLLVVSILTITFRAFDISIDKIPFSGITINFNPGVFAFLLTVSLIYFTLIFVLYYYIDIKNFELTEHQKGIERQYTEGISGFKRKYAEETADQVRLALERFKMPDRGLASLLGKIAESNLVEAFGLIRNFADSIISLERISESGERIVGYQTIPKDKEPAAYTTAERIVRNRLRMFWFKNHYNNWKFKRLKLGVDVTYAVRNYGTDGILPIALSAIAFLSLYNFLDLHWLRSLTPVK